MRYKGRWPSFQESPRSPPRCASAITGRFRSAIVLSHNGTWAQRAAVLWLTWEMTGSGFWLGLMAVADLLPVVVIGPVAGAIADRVNILTMIKITQVLAAIQSALRWRCLTFMPG